MDLVDRGTAGTSALGRMGSGHSAGARLLDVLLAASMLIAGLPLMLLIALAVWAADGGPVFFRHERLGRNGRPFRCWKFRSMAVHPASRLEHHLLTDQAAATEWALTQKLKRDPRVTPIGRFLRASSLDELPQLWNILRGDMSVVGPRPITAAEVPRYGAHFDDYCSVRPGVTGLWQVSGRNDLSYAERVRLDVHYAHNRSLALNLAILARTIPAVLARRGSY